jgi:hypothetical protein
MKAGMGAKQRRTITTSKKPRKQNKIIEATTTDQQTEDRERQKKAQKQKQKDISISPRGI